VAVSVVGIVVSSEISDLALFVETGYVCVLVVPSLGYKTCERNSTRLFWPYSTLTGHVLGSRYCLDADPRHVTAANSVCDRVRRRLVAIEH